ncbi:hypothetical protein LWI28_023357 [Acer negundo]|uniref:Pentatricopeptide repeat-containing protein n=1 Tax=Acer negundo TaxID=4023 RepID=A0AAD5IXD1_ACENE|nr:hypothetical protein LWI28_023357 [Acer negundo]
MVGRGIFADSVTYNSSIHGFCQMGLWKEATRIFDRMLERGVSHDLSRDIGKKPPSSGVPHLVSLSDKLLNSMTSQ